MIGQRVRTAYIVCVIVCGIIINAAYGVELLKEFMNPQLNNSVREILVSAIALEFGWAVLLLWAIGKPYKRRHIVFFTAVPMLIGNLLHSINSFAFAEEKLTGIALNLVFGGLAAGLFIMAFFLSKPSNLAIDGQGNGS